MIFRIKFSDEILRLVGPKEDGAQKLVAACGRRAPEHGDLETVFPRQIGDASREPVFLDGEIHDDDFAVKGILRFDVGIGRKKRPQGPGDERTGQHRKRQVDDAAGLFGQDRVFL